MALVYYLLVRPNSFLGMFLNFPHKCGDVAAINCSCALSELHFPHKCGDVASRQKNLVRHIQSSPQCGDVASSFFCQLNHSLAENWNHSLAENLLIYQF